jgi:hypothetical protein
MGIVIFDISLDGIFGAQDNSLRVIAYIFKLTFISVLALLAIVVLFSTTSVDVVEAAFAPLRRYYWCLYVMLM